MSQTPVTLLMAIHCHQPVGNFGFVFEEAYQKSYDPFLRVLARHPRVRLALHYSGCLLDWLREHHPEFLTRVSSLVRRGQVELLVSGYYEPILPLIPEADRQGQLAKMRAALAGLGQPDAAGLWLTERVWEPELPATLAAAGVRYTMVDTNQFLPAQPFLPRALQIHDEGGWDVLGAYATEYGGAVVTVFPASKRLRYWLPFKPVETTVDFLRGLPRERPAAITFADDGEKFGLWPKTHQWVYEEGWLERFFSVLEQEQAWLKTATFQDYLAHTPPSGRVYLPCGSYEEMLEWSGGNFRNFFTKYPEANAMQQKMLRVSRQLQTTSNDECRMSNKSKKKSNSQFAIRNSKLLNQAREELYAGQCNCAYWHGVFGGLYLSHLRRAVYRHLIAAEDLLRRSDGARPSSSDEDADGDGQEETILTAKTMSAVVDPADGGTITEWSVFGPRINLLDTLTRRPELYHRQLTAKHPQAVAAAASPASIHDLLRAKDADLEARITYDDHRRSGFVDYGLQRVPSLAEVQRSAWAEQQLWAGGAFQRAPARAKRSPALALVRSHEGGSIRKTIALSDRGVDCGYAVERLNVAAIGIEFTLGLRDDRYLEAAGQQQTHTFELREGFSRVSVHLTIDPPALLYHFPIDTISESEEGLERTYQGLCVICFWTLEHARAPKGLVDWQCRLRWSIGTG